MKLIDWVRSSPDARRAALARPAAESRDEVFRQAAAIITAVRAEGDAAIRRFTQQFGGGAVDGLRASEQEFREARASLRPEQIAALERAVANVASFHEAQRTETLSVETMPGVRCERITRAIDSVGLYVPAGSAPLPSTAIMLGVPARIAGCKARAIASSPGPDGRLHAAVLVAAQLCGVDTVYKMGGAQAIAALAFGTESVRKVDKIFGPGSAWVTAAKQIVAADPDGAAIDLPAGPSEVLVIADESANARFVAADLLAQAEHDAIAQVMLVTTSKALAAAVATELDTQTRSLSRRDIVTQSMANSRCILVADLVSAVAVSNEYAPEHLIIQTREPRALLAQVTSAGSVFLGEWSPESMGDYCSGTNHVLPTFGYARSYSGVSLLDYQKRITVQELSADGLRALGPTAITLSGMEGLDAHGNAVRVRLNSLTGGAS
ncbi:MAG TPA: histidinol dehydrogenase [Steroidobacteraceae bacterium]|jgi:histidinol dehydrogenase|nr:histidinol dehydrogenase [Steroidobacteraceae bacterium]